MQTISGQCHCGNLRFNMQWPTDDSSIPVRACSCAYCTRHGGVYTSHPEAVLAAKVDNSNLLSRYTFGTRTAEFHVCARCGVAPFVTSEIEGKLYAVVNVNCFEDVDALSFEELTTDFDGETVDSRLKRRTRTWIADVSVSVTQ